MGVEAGVWDTWSRWEVREELRDHELVHQGLLRCVHSFKYECFLNTNVASLVLSL